LTKLFDQNHHTDACFSFDLTYRHHQLVINWTRKNVRANSAKLFARTQVKINPFGRMLSLSLASFLA
jgi:hypothetical protein